MDLFYIDKSGDESNSQAKQQVSVTDEIEKLLQSYKTAIKKNNNNNKNRKKSDFSEKYNQMLKTAEVQHNLKPNVEKLLENSVITSDFEELHQVPSYEVSKRQKKKQRLLEKEKSKGAKWYGLPATEMTEEVKNDLEILKMRSVLDPKQFYKKNDMQVLPKYFQIGKVLDSPLDYYNNRLTKKERKRTLVDELLADAEFNKYNKRKYREIIEEKQKTHYKEYIKAKKLKKRK